MKIALIVPGFSADEHDWCIPALRNLAAELSRTDEIVVFALRYPHRAARYTAFRTRVIALGGAQARGAAEREGTIAAGKRAVRFTGSAAASKRFALVTDKGGGKAKGGLRARIMEEAKDILVLQASYTNPIHAEAICHVLNGYAEDPMGGGHSLPAEVLSHLPEELAKRPHAFSVLAFVNGEPAGLVNCFEGFSTFACRPLVNVHDVAVMPALAPHAEERRPRRRGAMRGVGHQPVPVEPRGEQRLARGDRHRGHTEAHHLEEVSAVRFGSFFRSWCWCKLVVSVFYKLRFVCELLEAFPVYLFRIFHNEVIAIT